MTTLASPPLDPPAPTRDAVAHLRLELDWRWRRPKPRPRLPKGEPRDDARPLRCVTPGETVSAPAGTLPFADASVGEVDAGKIFAYVRNDDGLADEIARVVRPGGTVRLVVPSTGPLAGLDAYNLFRYVVDITGRGPRPFEVAELGWRRHYREGEVVAMLGGDRFLVRGCRRSGLALGEMVRLVGLMAFRWLSPSRDGYRRVNGLAADVERRELGWEVRHGFWLSLTLERRETAAPAAGAAVDGSG